jgi:putative NADPH-quinone reductase
MRFLVVYAHPVEDSFQGALHRIVVKTLRDSGHDVDDFDLYAEQFQPVLSREERRGYHKITSNRAFANKEIARLVRCQGLVFIFPAWWYGMPAILKGYIDRVWIPGVAFEMTNGRTRPLLQNIVRFAVVTTYGSPWWLNKAIGDPNKRVFTRGISHLFARRCRVLWLAKYGLDFIDKRSRERFLTRVEQRIRTL